MGVLALIVVGWAAGTLLVRPVSSSRAETLMYRAYVGLCVCGVGVMVLGSVSLYAVRILMLFLAVAAIVYAIAKRYGRRDDDGEALRLPRLDFNRLESACVTAIIIANGLTLLSALAPVTSWDAGVAHLALPSDYARADRIGFLEGNVYSAYPHLMHSLFAYVFSESGETPAALTSWLFGLLACLSVYCLGRRADGRETGLIAAAIFATSPIFFSQAGTVSIDVAFAGIAAAALVCVFAWHDEQRIRWILLAGFLVGSACGVRHTGYLVAVLIATGLLLLPGRGRFRATAIFAGTALLAAGPWLLRSAIVVGNPVYPFLRGVFGSERLPDVQTTALLGHESIQGTGLLDFLMFPVTIVMRPELYDGWSASPGALLLLLGPPGLIIGGARARWLGAFSVAGGLCFFFFQRFARYMLPFFTPMMVVAAMASSRLGRLRRPVTVLLLFSFAFGTLLGTAMIYFKVPVVLGQELPAKYLARRVERYEAFLWVNRNLPETDTIMTFDPRSYYIIHPTFQNFEILRVLREMPIEEQVAWLQERNIRWIFYPEAYINESPVYRERGFADHLNEWRADTEHFRLAHSMELERPRADGVERVEIYEVLWTGPDGVAEDVGP